MAEVHVAETGKRVVEVETGVAAVVAMPKWSLW